MERGTFLCMTKVWNKAYICQRIRFPACMLSCFSHVWLFATPWTVACQAPLSMGFSRQEYWSGLSCPSPGDLRDPGIKSVSHISCIGRQVLYHKCHQITCLEGNTPTKKKKLERKEGRKWYLSGKLWRARALVWHPPAQSQYMGRP